MSFERIVHKPRPMHPHSVRYEYLLSIRPSTRNQKNPSLLAACTLEHPAPNVKCPHASPPSCTQQSLHFSQHPSLFLSGISVYVLAVFACFPKTQNCTHTTHMHMHMHTLTLTLTLTLACTRARARRTTCAHTRSHRSQPHTHTHKRTHKGRAVSSECVAYCNCIIAMEYGGAERRGVETGGMLAFASGAMINSEAGLM